MEKVETSPSLNSQMEFLSFIHTQLSDYSTTITEKSNLLSSHVTLASPPFTEVETVLSNYSKPQFIPPATNYSP